MNVRLGALRKFLIEELDRVDEKPNPNKPYDGSLFDDPSFGGESTLVPDDIKGSIETWSKKMGLR